ncbi:MAG: PKD domain-containing protein [Saprospiraceae bacterium]|nr:PKD domain-containing protein [Saprospiraceae bacterium]
MNLVLKIGCLLFFPTVCFLQPVADFDASNTQGCGALQVVFIDKSTTTGPAIVSWKWDLSGLFSDKQNPGRIFDKPGSYTVCLTVTDAAGNTSSTCKQNYIVIYEKPEPNFIISENQGCAPVEITFTDLSTSPNGEVVEWTWDIGGSANVFNTINPDIIIKSVYSFAGLYSMSLKVKDDKGCEATISKKDLLTIFSVPQPALQKTYLTSCELPWQVKMENLNIDANASYRWDFGNGQTFNGPVPPVAVFDKKGSYDLTLIIHKGNCTDTIFLKDYINTNPKKEISFEKPDYCLGDPVTFRDDSELGADSVRWEFGDGMISSDKTPSHIYTQAGCYTIKLYRWRGNCRDTIVRSCVNVIQTPEPNLKIDNQFSCLIPINVNAKGLSAGGYQWKLTGLGPSQTGDKDSVSFLINKFGTYNLDITFTSPAGCTIKLARNIEIKKFEANLPLQDVGGCVPYEVSLGDSVVTEVPITKYQWIVGNPAIFTSLQKNPTFMLNTVGRYDVRLIVTNAYGCKDTVDRKSFVLGGTPPVTDFIASPIDDCLNIERNFSQNCSPNADYWVWDFGDGNSATGPNVSHSYGMPGIFDITLVALHNGCASSITKPALIKVLEPVSNYEILYQCDDPNTVKLNNLSVGADSLYWEIFTGTGRDTIRDSILSAYTFPGRGKYTIKIFSKSFDTGCIHERLDTVFITDPVALYTPDTTRGCVPLMIFFENNSIDAAYSAFTFGGPDTLTTNSFTYTEGGIQTPPMLLVSDIHGCRDSFVYNGTFMANAIDPIAIFPDIVCVPQTISIHHSSRDSFSVINEIRWLIKGDTFLTDTLSLKIEAADYSDISLWVKDTWGCSDSIFIKDAMQGVLLQTGFTSDTLGCTTQEVLFVPSGNNANTNGYKWNFGDGSTDSTGITRHKFDAEGIYDICLTLYDIRGCENTHCEPSWIDVKDPVAAFSGEPLFETCPPLLTKFTNASSFAIAYQWDFGDQSGISFVTDPSHIYFEPDTFDVSLVAIRSESCRDTFVIKEYVTVLGPKGTFDFDIESGCTPLQVKFSATSDDYYRYYWDYGNGVIDSSLLLQNADEKTIQYDKPGTYLPKLIISDNAGCKRNFAKDEILVNEIKLNVIQDPEPLCGLPAGIQINHQTTSTSQATYYRWLFENVGDTLQFTGYDVSPVFSAYGNYSMLLIASTDNCTDTLFIADFAGVHPKPAVGFSFDVKNCQYNEMQFTNQTNIALGSIASYLWKIQGTTLSDTDARFTFQTSGNYPITLKATSDAGCIDSSYQLVEVLPNNMVKAANDTLICLGDSAVLFANIFPANANAATTWKLGQNVLCSGCKQVQVFPTDTTTYLYTVINDNGCISADSMTVRVAPVLAPEITLLDDTILCKGVLATLGILDYNPAYQYEWVNFDPKDCMNNCQSIQINPQQPGYFTAIVRNSYGCLGRDSIYVDVESTIEDFLVDEKFICEDSITLLSAFNVSTIKWTKGNEVLCAGCDTLQVKPTAKTTYTVYVTSDNGCPYSDDITVNILSPNMIDAGQDRQLCLGETLTINGSGFGQSTWSTNGQIQGSGLNFSTLPGQSNFYVLTSSLDECTLTDSMYTEVITKALIQAIGDTVCYGDEAMTSADGLAFKYVWKAGNKVLGSDKELQFVPDSSIWLKAIGTRTTCIPDTQDVFVFVHPKIEYRLLKEKYTLYFNSKIKVEADFDPNQTGYGYQWTPATGMDCDQCPEPVIREIPQSTLYNLVVTDETSACTASYDISVKLIEKCSAEGYYIPNIIYMNGSQSNQLFFTKSANPEEFRSIAISDRWGSIVYKSEGIDEVWDGKMNGRDLESGVYTYVVTAFCPESDELYHFAGDLTILR